MPVFKITDDGTRAYPHYCIREYKSGSGGIWVPIAWATSLAYADDIVRNLGAALHPDSLTLDDEKR